MPTPVIVQSSFRDAFPGNSFIQPVFDNPTTNGNSIVLPVSFGPGSNTLTVTSIEVDAGNEYVQVPGARVTDSSTNRSSDVWWCPSGASAQVITVNLSGPAGDEGTVNGTLYEVSGISGAVPIAATLAGINITDGSSFDGPSLNGGSRQAFYLTNLAGVDGNQQSVAAPWAILEADPLFALQSTATLVETGVQQAVFTPEATDFIGCMSGVVFSVGFSISGNAGVASALVSYSGTSSGSVAADGSGNYTIPNISNGSYTITPSLSGFSFSPTSQNVTLSGGDVTGINFTASSSPTHGWSPVDCRNYATFPNFGVVQPDGSVFYTGQTSSNSAVPGTDSRAAGAPVGSRVSKPVNSRVNPADV